MVLVWFLPDIVTRHTFFRMSDVMVVHPRFHFNSPPNLINRWALGMYGFSFMNGCVENHQRPGRLDPLWIEPQDKTPFQRGIGPIWVVWGAYPLKHNTC